MQQLDASPSAGDELHLGRYFARIDFRTAVDAESAATAAALATTAAAQVA